MKSKAILAAATLAALFLPGMPAAQQPLADAEVPALHLGQSLSPLPSRVVATFGEDIPKAYCGPRRPCYIELEAGEVLTDLPTVASPSGWDVVSRSQGSPPTERTLIVVKPRALARKSSLVIPTDRRLYWIELVNSRERHTAIVSFTWPDTDARARLDAAERRIEELLLEIGNELWRIRVDAEALGKALNPVQYHVPVGRAAGRAPSAAQRESEGQ